jgi:hypothetical protein
MTAAWGPLAGLIGDWVSDYDGYDVSFHSDQGKLNESRYREETSFTPYGPVNFGGQTLYGLDYRTTTWAEGSATPAHREIGYWIWDEANQQVVRCLNTPFATALMAGGTVLPDATSFKLEAVLGSNSYGILSNQYLDAHAKTTRYDVSIVLGGDTFSYDQTIVIEYQRQHGVVLHTDRNTLRRA